GPALPAVSLSTPPAKNAAKASSGSARAAARDADVNDSRALAASTIGTSRLTRVTLSAYVVTRKNATREISVRCTPMTTISRRDRREAEGAELPSGAPREARLGGYARRGCKPGNGDRWLASVPRVTSIRPGRRPG